MELRYPVNFVAPFALPLNTRLIFLFSTRSWLTLTKRQWPCIFSLAWKCFASEENVYTWLQKKMWLCSIDCKLTWLFQSMFVSALLFFATHFFFTISLRFSPLLFRCLEIKTPYPNVCRGGRNKIQIKDINFKTIKDENPWVGNNGLSQYKIVAKKRV